MFILLLTWRFGFARITANDHDLQSVSPYANDEFTSN